VSNLARRKPSASSRRTHLKRIGRARTSRTTSAGRVRVGMWNGAKYVSVVMLVLAVVGLSIISESYAFFVYEADIEGHQLLSWSEVYVASNVHEKSVFWLSAPEITSHLKDHPYIGEAEVSCKLPNEVTIRISELSPLIAWKRDGLVDMWAASDGTPLPPRETGEPRLLLVDDDILAGTAEGALNPGIARGMIMAAATMQDVSQFRYDSHWGLLFVSPYGWQVALGDGDDMEQKLTALVSVQEDLVALDVHPSLIDLRFPEAPYYR